MVRSLLFCFIFISSLSQAQAPTGFEQDFVQLQAKLETLGQKGGALREKTRQEIKDLVLRLNHEYSELKRECEQISHDKSSLQREIEQKRDLVKAKVGEAKKVEEDWSKRLSSAVHEVGSGLERAWDKIKKGDE